MSEWVTVPVEPTEEMLSSVQKNNGLGPITAAVVYKAMIAAAPKPDDGLIHELQAAEAALLSVAKLLRCPCGGGRATWINADHLYAALTSGANLHQEESPTNLKCASD